MLRPGRHPAGLEPQTPAPDLGVGSWIVPQTHPEPPGLPGTGRGGDSGQSWARAGARRAEAEWRCVTRGWVLNLSEPGVHLLEEDNNRVRPWCGYVGNVTNPTPDHR